MTESRRLTSLDAFRGMTIAGMILVNNPGTWAHVYPPLLHAPWNGWTPTDLIFPFFLFIMGVAIPFSFRRRLESGEDRGALLRHVVWRSGVLFALGLFMALYPTFSGWGTLRIMGVLQRIAVVYLGAAALYLYLPRKALPWVGAALLLGYWAAMTLVPVPGYGAGDLSPEGNLAAWLDRTLLGQEHLWRDDPWDPEGLLSSVPAVVTALAGIGVGLLLVSDRSHAERTRILVLAGLVGVAAGLLWGEVFPINKNLWTSSYVVLTAGLASLCLAGFYWTMEVRGWRGWAQPFVVYGMNAIAVFVLSGLLTKTLILWRVGQGETETSAWNWLYQAGFASWLSPLNASLAFALAYVAFWWFAMWLLYRRRIFVKI